MTRYDFNKTEDFLNRHGSSDDIYDDVVSALELLCEPCEYMSHAQQNEVWSTLLTCAELIATIQMKREA